MPPPRDPDFKFKSDTEGPTALKQQRLAHLRGSTPASAKPGPAAPGEEAEERVRAADGEVRLADEVGGAKKWDVEAITPRPPPAPPPQESMTHIISDTFQHPGERGMESFVHLYYLATEGRYATPEELAPVRNYAGPVLDLGLKTAFPELMIPFGIGAAINLGERSAKGETITTKTLVEQLSPFNAPREGLKPEPARALPSPASSPSKAGAPVPAAKAPATESFKPPTRLEDGRVGYPLSPTRPPRLDGEIVKSGAGELSKPSARADAATRPPPAAAAAAAAAAAEKRIYGRADIPLNIPLRTHVDPATNKIIFKETAVAETYHDISAPGQQPRYKVELTVDGYASNYRGKDLEAIVLHGSQPRGEGPARLMYSRGRQVHVQDKPRLAAGDGGFRQDQAYDLDREVTSHQFVEHFYQDHGIDLVTPARGGTGSARPLYLLACSACEGGRESPAQQLADTTGREVRAHSRYSIAASNPSHLFRPEVGVTATPGENPFLPLIKLRNRFRATRQEPDQLVHKKFQPNPQAAARAQAMRESAARRPLSFHDFPNPTVSTFTSTQPSSVTSPMASFTHSQAPGSLSVPGPSHTPSPSPQPTMASSLGSSFFDHVPPPKPPTFPLVMQSLDVPQHATLSQAPSSQALGTGTPSSASLSDFYGSATAPPQHPLAMQQAPLPQHAMMLGPATPTGQHAGGRLTPEELPETWV